MLKMKLGYLTVYRGNVSDLKNDRTEIGIKRYHFLKNRWYLNPTSSSLDRINRILALYEPFILVSDVSDHSVYMVCKFKENNL